MLQTIERNIYEGMNDRNVTALSNEIKNRKMDELKENLKQKEM